MVFGFFGGFDATGLTCAIAALSGATAIEWHRTLVRGETFARVWI